MCVLQKLRITSLVNLNINQHSHRLAHPRLITQLNDDSNLTQQSEIPPVRTRHTLHFWEFVPVCAPQKIPQHRDDEMSTDTELLYLWGGVSLSYWKISTQCSILLSWVPLGCTHFKPLYTNPYQSLGFLVATIRKGSGAMRNEPNECIKMSEPKATRRCEKSTGMVM